MPFQSALSGIRAASSDLSVTGNNIANASTTGFKGSRAEFGDVYATSLGAGSGNIGSGVQVMDVSQSFSQGNVSFTENELDLAINGSGFFVVSQGGEALYTRAGSFGLDADGFVVTNSDARLQGFQADETGNLDGIRGDIQIETSNLSPRQTTGVNSLLNLDSTEPVLQTSGFEFTTGGPAIGAAQIGLQDPLTTSVQASPFTLPITDLTNNPIVFDLSVSGASVGNTGTVTINLNNNNLPNNITDQAGISALVGAINTQIFSAGNGLDAIDVVASSAVDAGGNPIIKFDSIYDGEFTQMDITVDPANVNANTTALGIDGGITRVDGLPAVSNGYPAQSIDITSPEGSTVTLTAGLGATAATTASELNSLQGIAATASTNATISNLTTAGNATVTINGVDMIVNDLIELEQQINTFTNTILPGMTATLDPAGGGLNITSAVGDDIRVSIEGNNTDTLTIIGGETSAPQTLTVGGVGSEDASVNSVIIGGEIELVLEEDYTLSDPSPQFTGMFQQLTENEFTQVDINEFDPLDQETYNSATSMTIFDSLGNSHVLTQYFVKQPFDPADPTTTTNHWLMYVQVDDQDVGRPDTTLPPPQNIEATRASYNVYFNEDGSINDVRTEDIVIANWTPMDENGLQNGALGPEPNLAAGTTVIPDPPTSSNFVVDLEGTTQFGSEFAVNGVDQDGFTTGRLAGLNIADDGVIFARFTNGQSLELGQVVLAEFSNQQGLQPVGGTMWAETFRSGGPSVGTPGSASLGAIQSGSLEESNVDLSQQLVNLIIAQRNFQASAKTIETADAVTQTIINLR